MHRDLYVVVRAVMGAVGREGRLSLIILIGTRYEPASAVTSYVNGGTCSGRHMGVATVK